MISLQYFGYLIKYRSNPLHIAYLRGRKIADIGCGEGDFLAKDPANRIGVDIDAELVRRCKERGLEAHCMSATQLDFPNEVFDVVYGAELIEHFDPQNAVRFLVEAARVLKPGGIVYLTTPGERYVWTTFSHIKPYPPIAFEKLLGKSTEGFMLNKTLPLQVEAYYAFSAACRSRILTGIKRALDIAMPPRWPSGYVIILRKRSIL